MALIEFKDLPDTTTPLNAANLNNNFMECSHTGDIIYSGDITTTGTYPFVSGTNANQYRFVIVEFSDAVASQKELCLIPAIKIVGETSQYVSATIVNSIVFARITIKNSELVVMEIGTAYGTSAPHIRRITGIK